MTGISHWQHTGGGQFRPTSPHIQEHLDVAVYVADQDMGGVYLQKKFNNFDLGPKLYELQPGFVDRVIATHQALNRSVGVLLQGLKGAGKTVIAKQICNESKLPVIILQNNNPAIVQWLAFIQQPCVIFIDEYEKLFDDDEGEQNIFLSLMDGATSAVPHIFVLTVNHAAVNENLFDRPGRVRYRVVFSDLPKHVIEMVVDDILQHTQFRDQIIDYLGQRTVLSIDSVKSVVEEVNIHAAFDDKEFDRVFNLSKSRPSSFELYEGESWFGSLTEPYIKAWLPSNNANNYNSVAQCSGMRFVQTKYDATTDSHNVAVLRNLTAKERDTLQEISERLKEGDSDGDGDERFDLEETVWDEATDSYITPLSQVASYSDVFNERFNPTVTDAKFKQFLSNNTLIFVKNVDLTVTARPSYHDSYVF